MKNRSNCPVSCTLEILGDKWTLLIIRDLMYAKACTFGDFLKAPEKIATNILTSRLQSLEENRVIRKMEHPDSKAKVLYQLTRKGIDLLPLLVEINLWADKYLTIPQDKVEMINSMKKDKSAFIKRISQKLDKF